MERHAERRRLLLVRHRRLDRLVPAHDRDPEPLLEDLVERLALELGSGQPGHERLTHVERLDRHRLPVGEAEATDDHHRLRRRHMQQPAQVRARRSDTQLERPASGHHPPTLHVLGERGHGQLLRDLRLAHERPAAVLSHEQSLAYEVVEGRADREARYAELACELALGRNRVPDVELLDQVEDTAPGLALLRYGLTRSADCRHHVSRLRRRIILPPRATWSRPPIRPRARRPCSARLHAPSSAAHRRPPGRRNGAAQCRRQAGCALPATRPGADRRGR